MTNALQEPLEQEEKNPPEVRHLELVKRLTEFIKGNFPANKVNMALRLTNELLRNPQIVFQDVTGRTIRLENLDKIINTFDLIKILTTPPFLGGARKPKKMLIIRWW